MKRIFTLKSTSPRIPTIDNDVDQGEDENAPQGVIAGFSAETENDKASFRERLDAMSSSRLRPNAIKLTSRGRHASGGNAEVVQARFRQWYSIKAELVAVKQLQNVKTEKTRRGFAREVGLMAKMSHENIVKFIGFVENLENGTAWIVMPWESNGNVSEFLAKRPCEIVERVSLIWDTFKGLRYLHTRQPPICHGDLKSHNILVSSSYRAIITDFGSSREITVPEGEAISGSGRDSTTRSASPPIQVAAAGNKLSLTELGWSLRWAPPEVVNGKRPSLSSDIWAAGWVCWEVMTNTLPFHQLNSVGVVTLAVINGEVPSPRDCDQLGEVVALCTLMTECWAVNPNDRPSVAQCCNRLGWVPSTPPSGWNRSGSKEQSTQMLMQKGWMQYQQSNYKQAALLFQEALSLAESAGNQEATADALRWLGSAYREQSRFIQAEESYIRAKEIYTRIGYDKGRANVSIGLGELYRLQAKDTRAYDLFTQAREVYVRAGDQRGLAEALRGLGELYRSQFKLTQAERLLTRAQAIYARLGIDAGRGCALRGLGDVYFLQANYTRAEQSYNQAQEYYARVGDIRGHATVSGRLGTIYRLQSRFRPADGSYSQAQFNIARHATMPRRPGTVYRTAVDQESDDENAPQGGLGGGRRDNQPSVRETLNALSDSRIRSTAIEFTSGGGHGSGGKAEVVQARFRKWYSIKVELVAVKKVRNVKTERTRSEFAREVGLMASMSHENIVKFVGFVEDLENGTAWIVMSWEPNGNVSEFLAKGSYEIPERVCLIRDIFKGVRFLHTRQPPICHGDLKSLNILVNSSYRAIITDFGSAREIIAVESETISEESGQPLTTGQPYPPIHVAATGDKLTLTGPSWSLRWASPEVVNGRRPSLSSDIWAAGWVCWEVMTNTLPFHELNSVGTITLAAINGEVPSPREDGQLGQIVALCTLMTDCWAFDPRSRPSVTECWNQLRWMPAAAPSDGNRSGSKEQSTHILIQKGVIHYQQSDYKKAASLLEQALSFAESAGDQRATADALRLLGPVYRAQSKFIEAEESYVRAKNLYTHIRDVKGRANALKGLGDVYRLQSKHTKAEELFTQAQEVYTRIGNERGLASTLRGLGDVYCFQSKYTQAEKSLTQAEEICARIGHEDGRGGVLKGLGEVYLRQSKYTEAEQALNRALEIYARTGNNQGQANTFKGLGDVYRLQSKYPEAEESYTRAQEIYTTVGDELGRANVLQSIGELRGSQGRNLEATSYYSEARDSYAHLGMPRDAERASNLLADLVADRDPSGTSPQASVRLDPPSPNISP